MLSRFAALLSGQPRQDKAQEDQRLHLATCVVLVEAAQADREFTEDERLHIVEVLRQRFDLPHDEARELIDEAQAVRDESHDIFRFTSQINQNFTVPEKIQIMEDVWRLIYSDGTLHSHEDHLVHKLQNLLNLNHPQLIEAKMKVLNERRNQA